MLVLGILRRFERVGLVSTLIHLKITNLGRQEAICGRVELLMCRE